MATAEDSADNELWDASVGKSWADLVDDDSKERPSCRKSWADLVDEESQSPRKNYRLRSNSFKIPALKGDPFDEGANFGNADGRSTIPKVDPLPNFGRNLSRNGPKTPVKEQPDIPQEDISLTGHLDVKLGLVSPAKSTRRTVTLKPTAPRSSPSKASKRKPDANGRDPMTMPSPSKIRRTPKKDASDGDGLRTVTMTPPSRPLLSRKRVRDMLTPTPSKDGKQRVKRDAETDPDILARRQRQIDYGKNTLGYERYTQMVPREKREKNHPKTPPIGIKFSRRAWDGMIKVWRQRLHFWDPPSEGGGNPQCLEIQSDMSDCYSDSSLPNTPVQEMKRKKNERTYRYSRNRSGYSDDLDSGCTPLLD